VLQYGVKLCWQLFVSCILGIRSGDGSDNSFRRRLTKTMEGMSTTQLKLLFDALDADKNGTLDREEVKKLVETVLQEAAVTDAVMDSCFEEMDADNSGTVEW